MNFHLRPYNQYILNIVTNIYLGLDFRGKIEFPYSHNHYGCCVGNLAYSPLVCKWLIATKYAISLFLSVSCYTELLAGDNLQKNEMCFCL